MPALAGIFLPVFSIFPSDFSSVFSYVFSFGRGDARSAHSPLRDTHYAVGPIAYFVFKSEAGSYVLFLRDKVK